MKTKLVLAVVSSFILQHSAFAQGALTPPGAPAPMMKSLAQIEPRIPISSVPFTIFTSGSYYFTTNLTVSSGNAITIANNGVTLDLGGWTLSSTAASATGYGILLNGSLSDVTVFNGHIRGGVTNNGSNVYGGSGFANGIFYFGNAPANTHVRLISVSGCLSHGINLGAGNTTLVEDCTVQSVGGIGIDASVIKSSVATGCGASGIYGDDIFDSRGESASSIGGNSGLSASRSAHNCNGKIAGNGDGLTAKTAQNCYGSNAAGGYGLFVTDIAIGCSGYSFSGTGLSAFLANTCRGTTTSGVALAVTHNVNSF